jgi:hypothetical protein
VQLRSIVANERLSSWPYSKNRKNGEKMSDSKSGGAVERLREKFFEIQRNIKTSQKLRESFIQDKDKALKREGNKKSGS